MIRLYGSALSLLLAGSFFFSPFAGRVRGGVTINGAEVGGMRYEEAEQAVRERLRAETIPFAIATPDGEYAPEVSYSDNAAKLVRSAKKGETLRAEAVRTWVTAEAEIAALCARCARDAQDAELQFSAKGFVYIAERKGIYCDYAESLCAALDCLHRGGGAVSLVVREYSPAVTEADLRARTRLLASFTTYFNGDNTARSENIALAASRIAGTVIEAGGEFSFNRVVGKRTRENGFQDAVVILDGEFVPGVGGGVCQASTTLMNAALRAGMKITESRNHSLSVGYVPPSLDAMVSEYSDLKFKNPYDTPVYLLAQTGKSSVTFRLYGLPDGKRYETESRVLFRLTPPPAEEIEGEEDKVIRAEKEGLASESYLLTYDQAGRLLSRKLFRRDTYAAQRGKVQVKPPAPEGDETEQPETEEPELPSPPSDSVFSEIPDKNCGNALK